MQWQENEKSSVCNLLCHKVLGEIKKNYVYKVRDLKQELEREAEKNGMIALIRLKGAKQNSRHPIVLLLCVPAAWNTNECMR